MKTEPALKSRYARSENEVSLRGTGVMIEKHGNSHLEGEKLRILYKCGRGEEFAWGGNA